MTSYTRDGKVMVRVHPWPVAGLYQFLEATPMALEDDVFKDCDRFFSEYMCEVGDKLARVLTEPCTQLEGLLQYDMVERPSAAWPNVPTIDTGLWVSTRP